MASHYLLKTEPSEYSFADLQRDGLIEWDGVTSPAGLKHLREMPAGAELVIYETANRKSAVGTARVVSVDPSDPKKPIVRIKAGKSLAVPVSCVCDGQRVPEDIHAVTRVDLGDRVLGSWDHDRV